MAFLWGLGSKGNLCKGSVLPCDANEDAAKTVKRSNEIFYGKSPEGYSCVHRKPLKRERIDLHTHEYRVDFTERSSCIYQGGVAKSFPLKKALRCMFNETGLATPAGVCQAVLREGPKVGTMDRTAFFEKYCLVFKPAPRIGERGRESARAIFLSGPGFRCIAAAVEAISEKYLIKIMPIGMCGLSPFVRASTAADAFADPKTNPLLLSGDCTKFNESIDARTIQKVMVSCGQPELGALIAMLVRNKMVWIDNNLEECPGGMLMGMFNYTATAAAAGSSINMLSFSDDFVAGGTESMLVETLVEMNSIGLNVSLKKTTISSKRLELNSAVCFRDNGSLLFRGPYMMYGPDLCGPFRAIRNLFDCLSFAVDINAMKREDAERCFQSGLVSIEYRYKTEAVTGQPRPWWPVCLGGSNNLTYSDIVGGNLCPALTFLSPFGPDPPDDRCFVKHRPAGKKRRAEEPLDVNPLIDDSAVFDSTALKEIVRPQKGLDPETDLKAPSYQMGLFNDE